MDPTDGAEQQVTITLDPTAVLEAELDPDPIKENQACVEALSHLIEKAMEKAERKTIEDLYYKTVTGTSAPMMPSTSPLPVSTGSR